VPPTQPTRPTPLATDARALATEDERETRRRIDAQLRAAGWEADVDQLRWARGARPAAGRNMAIAEVPTSSGPVDYVLFVGLTPVAVVEAKKAVVNCAAAVMQARRYSRDFVGAGLVMPRPPRLDATTPFDGWVDSDGYTRLHIPFAYATNGRDYVEQLETQSGIHFVDLRKTTNHPRALTGWHRPERLVELLEERDADAPAVLADESTEYLRLRDYQLAAIRAAEQAIVDGRRALLLAMATGTGKTRTMLGLAYRLLVSGLARRILFLVDRKDLGEQTASVFATTPLKGDLTFAGTYKVADLDAGDLDVDVGVNIATVQSLARRIVRGEGETPPVDAYDVVIIDESHRGYTLDIEATEGEAELRGYNDFISSYRRVIDHFDAVRIGLTATPALHTVEIFGNPVFSYSYREAVIDGYLVDHDPPVRILTQLAKQGIHFDAGDEVRVESPAGARLTLLPDELHFDVADFNRRVIAPAFNEAVCARLAEELDPQERAKTIVFCVDDKHADLVVDCLTRALVAVWGESAVERDTVLKITGATTDENVLKKFRTERVPLIAVTVDRLSTGIDVPAVCNIVFLRRVRSRILYEQMLGRATRLCPELGKQTFRIFDAVDLYAILENVSSMPSVANPSLSTDQLLKELLDERSHALSGDESTHATQLVETLVVRLRRVVARAERNELDSMAHDAALAFADLLGCALHDLPRTVRKTAARELANLLQQHDVALAWLVNMTAAPPKSATGRIISSHPDTVIEVFHGFGKHARPEDYLTAFGAFVDENRDRVDAIVTVLTRPRDLTRAQLRELRLKLSERNFTEPSLQAAYKATRNVDIAATIIDFVRSQALGAPVLLWNQRVEHALQRVLGAHSFTQPQRKWLERLATQLKHNVVLDRETIDNAFETDGGYRQLNTWLGGQLEAILAELVDAAWSDVA
jgi:type I restriction enzyme R subunit